MIVGALLAKGVADFTFVGAFLWYLVKFIISVILAFCAILLGVKWRKSKNEKEKRIAGKANGATEETKA